MPCLLRPFTGYYITIQLQYYIHTTITLEMPARVHGKPCIVPSMGNSKLMRRNIDTQPKGKKQGMLFLVIFFS